ncbi:MAG TPA: PilZ domain-containing protein [Phycisphaerae bacterium]|nr:PilZ domain-containing protein [Phycisphaerae bacterium]
MRPPTVDELARQHKRHETAFQSRVEPHPDHAAQFRLSFPDALSGLDVIDVSAGGVGIRCGIFIPKNLRLTLHISDVTTADGIPQQHLAVRVVVRRCAMIDHKPTYQIGMQFLDATGPDEQTLIQAAKTQREAAANAEKAREAELVGAGGKAGA